MDQFLSGPDAFAAACEHALKNERVRELLRGCLGPAGENTSKPVESGDLQEQLKKALEDAANTRKELEQLRSRVKELEGGLVPTEQLTKLSFVSN